MALADIIAKNKKLLTRGPGGVLSEETPESVQALSEQSGLAAPPVTPLGQGLIGANPDQAKMAGTPQQKQAALQIAQHPDASLSGAMRRGQVRTEKTGTEQQAAEKSENLQNLGNLGDRVASFMQAQKQNVAQQAQAQTGVQLKATGESQIYSQVAPENLESFKQKLEAFQQDPTNMQLLVDAGNLMGGKTINPEEVANLYQGATEAISSAGASAFSDKLAVSDLLAQPEFGYTPEQLSGLLGVTPEELQGYSISQLEEKVNQLAQEEFSKSQQLEQQASSGQLGAAERSLARQQARETSATGVRSTEADVAQLEEQIAAGQQVTFGGKSYNVDDLLKDDTVTQIITDYLTNPDSPESQKLAKSEPELLQLIEKNQVLFEDAIGSLKKGTTEFSDIQESNKQLANVGNVAINEKILEAAIPGWGKLSASKFQIDPNSALGYMRNNPAAGEKIATQLEGAIQLDPEYAKQFAELSSDELAKLNIEQNSPQWNKFMESAQASDRLQNIAPNDVDSILAEYFGMPVSPNQVQPFLEDNKARNALGVPSGSGGLVDSDGDGELDSSKQILSNLKSQTPKPSLKDAVQGNVSKFQQGSMSQPSLDGYQGDLYNKLGSYAKDGVIDSGELSKAFKDMPTGTDSYNDIAMLMQLDKNPPPGMDKGARKQLGQVLSKARIDNSKAEIDALEGFSLGEKITTLSNLLSGKVTKGAQKGTPRTKFFDADLIADEVKKLSKELADQFAAAQESPEEKLDRQAQSLGDPAYISVGRAIESLGKALGDKELQKAGKTIDNDYINHNKMLVKLGYKVQDAGKFARENATDVLGIKTGGKILGKGKKGFK